MYNIFVVSINNDFLNYNLRHLFYIFYLFIY